jgi:methionyl-tRNA formyltransferase
MSLNIVFMGTPDFAKSSLESIVTAGHNVITVMAQPDKPKGRGMKLVAPPVKEYAVRLGIPILQPSSIKTEEFIDEIKRLNPDVIVVAAYGKILPKAILDIPKYGCINVHASLLPKYRGAAPIQWAIVKGEKVTGITTMYMDTGLDTGDMILKKEVLIDQEDTAQSLYDKLAVEGGKVLIQTLDLIERGLAQREQQNCEVCYAPILKKEDGLVDWTKPANEIRNLVRGLNPWPGAHTYLKDGRILKLWKIEIMENESGIEPGTIIIGDQKGEFIVSTGTKDIKILELQLECCKKMCSAEYLRGNKICVGHKFTMGRIK